LDHPVKVKRLPETGATCKSVGVPVFAQAVFGKSPPGLLAKGGAHFFVGVHLDTGDLFFGKFFRGVFYLVVLKMAKYEHGKITERMRNQFRSWQIMGDYFGIKQPGSFIAFHIEMPPDIKDFVARCNRKYEATKRRWAIEN
jgi:hypothetical protein